MDVSGRMNLGHVQRVVIPEFRFNERTAHILKSHGNELGFHFIKKLPLRMFPAESQSGGIQVDVVLAKGFITPIAVFEKFWRELGDLFDSGSLRG